MFEILNVIMWAVVVLMVWVMICNNRTHGQRQKIIDFVYDYKNRRNDPDYQLNKRQFDDVHYNKHMLSLLTFRDPRKLYPFLSKGGAPHVF